MTDRLSLSELSGKDLAAEDKIIRAYQAAEAAKSQKSLDELAALQKRLDALKAEVAQAKPTPPPPGKTRHVAHATKQWKAVCTAPDYCRVGKDIIAFDSFATLENKKTAAINVKACGTAVYCQGDIIQGVQADAGQHITAGTSQGSGHVKILEGHDSVKVGPDKIPIARHDSKCLVNCDASGNGGAAGKLVTEQKTVGGAPATAASNPDAPPGERTSPQLERLQDAKAKIESGQLDFNALDEYINFKDANQGLDGLIGQIQGTPGGATDYLAQGTRGLLGFGKDIVTGVGELAYEGIKGVPKLGRMALTSDGRALAQIDGQILAENMRLGNITPGTVGQGALDMGAAIVKPITDPWKRGDYVEAVTRGAAELLSAPIAWTKAQKAAQAAKAKAALDAAEAAKAKAALDAAEAARAKAALEAEEAAGDAAKAGDGVHVSATPVKPKGGAWDYAPNWEKWEKDGGRVVPNPDGSVNYIRKDGVEVLYNKEGFPDFSPHAKHSVEINAMKGDHYWDFKAANEKIGLTGSKPPEGFTWHHVQDGKTMQLIPQSIHNAPMGGFSHAGGVYSLGP